MMGQLVGQYRITDKLGEGGMGTVYKAMDVMIEREVAIKMLRPEIAGKPDLLQRFRAEAITLAKLNHAGIATLYNFMQHGDDYFMVMEYVPGRTLEEVERESGALPWQIAVPLFEKILDAVQPAHEFGILHRDIKPANIMLTTWGAVKVMDFGIARVLGAARTTREGSMVGTIEYIAPERVEGKESDARGDIYSLGVVLFEMLSGRLPFQCDSEWELMRCHLQDPLPSLYEVQPDVPAEIENVLRRATAKSPDARFSRCDEFTNALRSASGNIAIGKKAIIDLVGAQTVRELGTAGHVTPAGGSDHHADGASGPMHGISAEAVAGVANEPAHDSPVALDSKRATPFSSLRAHWRLASVAAVVLSIAMGLLIGLAARHSSQPDTATVPERAQPAVPSPSSPEVPVGAAAVQPSSSAPATASAPATPEQPISVSPQEAVRQPVVFSPTPEVKKSAPRKKQNDLHSEALKALNQ
jgi:tRNA A-37 threonylcarbamoyl transferase component Bud32